MIQNIKDHYSPQVQIKLKSINIILTLLAIGVVTILPQFGLIPVPFGYSIPILVFIGLYLKRSQENFASIGFSFRSFTKKALITGTATGILLFLFLHFAFFPLLNLLVQLPETDVAMYRQLKGNTPFYIFLLLMGWIVGGLYEEIVFHGFIFTRLEKIWPGAGATLAAFLLTAVIFGLYHVQLGYEGMINAFVAGAVYHGLILYKKRNLWYGIICHGVFDTIALTILYLGYQ
jgi:membrane protease YdiL (CAAX protease family)